MPQQRQDQHHQSTMMHPASAAGPPIVATPPAYSTQYVAYSPQQFPNQPLVQHVPHYQSQVRVCLVDAISLIIKWLSPKYHIVSSHVLAVVMCFKACNKFYSQFRSCHLLLIPVIGTTFLAFGAIPFRSWAGHLLVMLSKNKLFILQGLL